MKKVLLTIVLILVILAGACALTNPSKEKHIDAIQDAYMGKLDDKSYDFLDGKSLTKIVLQNSLDYKSFGLCSTGRILDKDVSFGILGHVFVLEK